LLALALGRAFALGFGFAAGGRDAGMPGTEEGMGGGGGGGGGVQDGVSP
jgi:hypothetical protein